MLKTTVTPHKIRLDASTICQLKCPSCPTTSGEIAKSLKSGFLKFDDFKNIVDNNPWIELVELSNWGESLLNPQLLQILQYAYERGVHLSLGGANLNTVKPQVLEGLVKYQLRFITCSIDGASPGSYSVYRVRGDFDRVIRTIERINELKRRYDLPYPELTYQFVAFGHNEHEIQRAKALAERLDMRFALKLNWDDLYDRPFSPVKDRGLIARESGLGVADRAEFRDKFGRAYLQKTICAEIWTAPQVNFDGRVLGCCVNYWDDYGNAFREGLLNVLNNERMQYARSMLLGKAQARADIACTNCKFYKAMQADGSWIRDEDVGLHQAPSPRNQSVSGKVIAICGVKNESDIIEAFVRHNIALADHLIIMDNGSSDGTWEILKSLVAEGLPVSVKRGDPIGKAQSAWMSMLMIEAARERDVEWIVPLDGDEFLPANIRELLSRPTLDNGPRRPIGLAVRTYLPNPQTHSTETNPVAGVHRYLVQAVGPWGHKIIVPVNYARLTGITLEMGNHELTSIRILSPPIPPAMISF